MAAAEGMSCHIESLFTSVLAMASTLELSQRRTISRIEVLELGRKGEFDTKDSNNLMQILSQENHRSAAACRYQTSHVWWSCLPTTPSLVDDHVPIVGIVHHDRFRWWIREDPTQ